MLYEYDAKEHELFRIYRARERAKKKEVEIDYIGIARA